MVIYLITNKINGKQYVGKTTLTMEKRWFKHIYDANSLKINCSIQRAIRKYGSENFSIEKIDETLLFEELGKLEIKYIEEYCTFRSGYNQTLGGDGASPGENNPMYGVRLTGETNPFYGKKHSEETKKKMSEKAKGKYSGENNPMYGVRLTGETNGMYGKEHSEKTKKKISETRLEKSKRGWYKNSYGGKKSKSHREALSVAIKKRFSDPNERKKMSEAAKKRKPVSEEVRLKMSLSQKKRWEKK